MATPGALPGRAIGLLGDPGGDGGHVAMKKMESHAIPQQKSWMIRGPIFAQMYPNVMNIAFFSV